MHASRHPSSQANDYHGGTNFMVPEPPERKDLPINQVVATCILLLSVRFNNLIRVLTRNNNAVFIITLLPAARLNGWSIKNQNDSLPPHTWAG